MSSSSCNSSSSSCSRYSLLETESFITSSDVSDSVELSADIVATVVAELSTVSTVVWLSTTIGGTETGLVPTIGSISL